MNNKTLGLIALAGAPFLLLSSFMQPLFSFMPERQFYGAWSTIYVTGWMCSIYALQRLQAAGNSRFGKAITRILLVALLLANLSNLYQLILPGASTKLFFILDSFWPISNLLMLVTSVTVLVAKRLQGWRRFVPLVAGLWLPVLIVSANIFGRTGTTGTISGVYSAIAYSLMALAVLTAKEEIVIRRRRIDSFEVAQLGEP
jgi:hypothetical protein